jgi:hypothetical protein
MKSLTIHNIEEPLLAMLRERAKKDEKSINQTIKEMIEKSVGIKVSNQDSHRSEFEEFSGIWSKTDVQEFEKATKDLEKIDRDDWK